MKLWSNSSVPKTGGGFNPERRLLAAVLQRAITDFLTTEGELQSSAQEWLYGVDDPNEAFSFTYICEALDFHQEELRKAIRKQFHDIQAQRNKAIIEDLPSDALAAAAVA